MAKNPKYQHEPIYPPRTWNDEECRFVYSIERLLDEIYQKIGALTERVKALEEEDDNA